jgi:hypothetical protein
VASLLVHATILAQDVPYTVLDDSEATVVASDYQPDLPDDLSGKPPGAEHHAGDSGLSADSTRVSAPLGSGEPRRGSSCNVLREEALVPRAVGTQVTSIDVAQAGMTVPSQEELPRGQQPPASAVAPSALPRYAQGASGPPFLSQGVPPEVAMRSAQEAPQVPPVDPPAAPDAQYGDVGSDVVDYAGSVDGCSNQLCGDLMGFCGACCDAGMIVGFEGTFLAPMGEPHQRVVLTDLTSDHVFSGSSRSGLGCGVRTWLGLQRCGWGFRVGYWHFSDETIEGEPAVPEEGQATFCESFALKANALDLELTQGLCWGCWRIGASFGGRWARLERTSTVAGYGILGNGVELCGLAAGATDIEGPGFTFSFDGRRPLGCCFCGWNLYWRYRGSVLWVCPAAYAMADATAVTAFPTGTAHARNEAYACADGTTNAFISEVQFGLQYERCLCCMPATVFFRAGVEYQHWTTGEAYAMSDSFAFLEGGPPAFGGRVDASADAHDGDLDLFGFVLSAGLTW